MAKIALTFFSTPSPEGLALRDEFIEIAEREFHFTTQEHIYRLISIVFVKEGHQIILIRTLAHQEPLLMLILSHGCVSRLKTFDLLYLGAGIRRGLVLC